MKKRILPVAVPLLVLSGVAAAQGSYPGSNDFAPYVGASLGLLRYDESGLDPVSPSLFIARIGLPITPYLAVEGRIGTGISSDNSAGASVSVSKIAGAYVKGSLPIMPTFAVYAVGGVATLGVDRNFGDGGATDTGLSYGLGGDVSLPRSLGVNFEWTHFPGGTNAGYPYHLDVLSAGVTWHF